MKLKDVKNVWFKNTEFVRNAADDWQIYEKLGKGTEQGADSRN